MEKFNKNEWQSEICPQNQKLFMASSCSYVDGDEIADCKRSKSIDFSKFDDVTETERICSPLLYSDFLTHIDLDTIKRHSTPMVFDERT